jgi:putative flippase GtrA
MAGLAQSRPRTSLAGSLHLAQAPVARLGALVGIGPQLSRYALVSLAALALDFALYLLLMTAGLGAVTAGVLGYAAGTGLHYVLSTRFVFDAAATDKVQARLFGEFVLSGIAGIGITALVIALGTGTLGLSALPAKVLAAGISFLAVFALRRTVVFARTDIGRTWGLAPNDGAGAPASSVAQVLAELRRTPEAVRAAWLLALATGISVVVLARLTGVGIIWEEFWTLPALASAMGLLGLLLRAHGRWRRIGDVAEAAALLGLLAVFVPLLTCILARSSLPLADRQLIAWDAALGLDWPRIVALLKEHETASLILSHAYASLMHQPTLLLLVLGAAGLTCRLQQFVLAWAAALLMTALVFPLAPALGGYLHYGIQPADVPFIKVHAAWLHATVLEPLRNGTMTELGRLALEGIVTFPSFHASAAILLAWGFWGVPFVRWLALPVNVAMLVSCLFVGAHYVVDLIAGALVAWAGLVLAGWFAGSAAHRAELAWTAR